jgi:hypothetical protein
MRQWGRDPILGRPWGNYRVAEKIGEGGMSAVYRMDHVSLPRRKAIKVLEPPPAYVFVDHLRRFLQEAVAACAIDSDRIVRVDDIGEWPDGPSYIVMEWVDGRSLADELARKKPMALDTALKLLYRLADVIALAHAKGIVHRDLKPQNILLPRDSYIPKVCDFGIASVAMAPREIQVVNTQERAISGTPGYQSPEQLAALPTDGRTDIYSLGVIAYQALTGELPHEPVFPYDPVKAAKFLKRPVPSIASKRPATLEAVPQMVEDVIARALAKDVGRRYTTAIEFRDDVGECLAMMRAEEDGVTHNRLYTKMTTMADRRAPAPPLRTPAGYVDGMIGELHSGPLSGAVTLADVTVTVRRPARAAANGAEAVPEAVAADPMTLGEPSEASARHFPDHDELRAIYRVVRRRFGILSEQHEKRLTPKQERVLRLLQVLNYAAARDAWTHTSVPFSMVGELLADFSPKELEILGGLMRALQAGHKTLADWLAKHWE